MLTFAEKYWLDWHASHSPAPDALRARLVLLSESGAHPEAIAESLGVPFIDVTMTLQGFSARRLADFPRPAFTLAELLELAHADSGPLPAHARRVADSALTLFDSTTNLHHLPAGMRPVLETAARLHNFGALVDEPQRHTAGRELLLALTLTGFSESQQHLVADVIGLHRKKVKPAEVAYLVALSPVRQRQTLALAALLRVADGLDASATQTTELHGVVVTPEGVTLRLAGAEAKSDGARARKRADLWRKVFHLPLETAPAPEPPPDLQQLAATELTLDTPLVEVTRRSLATHLLRWQANETNAMEGDAQAIKALRVSARRWRQALTLFGPHFQRQPTKRLRQIMREAERTFGQLRDWEALLTDVRVYQSSLAARAEVPEEQTRRDTAELQSLLTVWEKERANAAFAVKKWLGGPRAADLHTALSNFLSAPPARSTADTPLKTVAPPLLREAVATVATAQAALADDKPRSYHDLRLAFKQMRYALEFLAPALPPDTPGLIEDLVKMQDRLGALNDTQVLQKRLDDYLDVWAEQQAKRKAPQLHGAHALLEYLRTAREGWSRQLRELNTDWSPVRAAKLKQRVNALLRSLK